MAVRLFQFYLFTFGLFAVGTHKVVSSVAFVHRTVDDDVSVSHL